MRFFRGLSPALEVFFPLSHKAVWLGVAMASLLVPAVVPAAMAQTRIWSATEDRGGVDQPGFPRFSRNYFDGGRDFLQGRHALTSDLAGNVYVTGFTSRATEDFLTVKYDRNGVRKWAVTYDGGSSDMAHAVAVDLLGNVYVTGESTGPEDGPYGAQPRFVTIKYNAGGVQQWVAAYNGGVWSIPTNIAVGLNGNVYVTGETYSTDDFIVMTTIKYSPAGVSLWVRHPFLGFEREESAPYDLAVDSGGNVYVTGFVYKPAEPDQMDYLTVKYSPTGTRLWMHGYDSGGQDRAFDLEIDPTGTAVYVTGTSGTVRYNASGVPQWTAPFAGAAHALTLAFGSVYVTGASGADFVTARYNAATGARLWSTVRDGGGTDAAYDLQLSLNGLWVTGNSVRATGSNALTVGYNVASGTEIGAEVYDSGGNDFAYAMTPDFLGGFYTAGYSGNGVEDDFRVTRYAPTVQAASGIKKLKISPSSIAGGCKTAEGRIDLTGPAPAGGAVIRLASSNPVVGVPASVTVPAGAKEVTFPVTTAAVTETRSATVTATYGGVQTTETVRVRPARGQNCQTARPR